MNACAAAGPAGIGPDGEMLVELVGLHAQAMRRMPWVQALLVLGIGIVIHAYVVPAVFAAWGAVTLCVEIGRARYSAIVLRRGADLDPKPVHAAFVVLAAASGAATGLGAALFLPRLPILAQALVGIILFATPAAGVAVSQSSRYIVLAYALFILVPTAGTWSLLHRGQTLGVMGLTILYCAVIALAAADGEKLLLRSVKIRHERDRLVLDLEQRNAEVQAAVALAEQSALARARVLAAASHDLRQPLHALSVYSAVLASKPAPELLNEVSENIDQIVRALGNLLNGLLDLSRLSAGYYVPEHQVIAMNTLIAGVCSEFSQSAAQKGLALTQQLAPVQVQGDAVALARIARNLIDNAIKYTDRGEVRVTLGDDMSEGAPRAVLAVSDTGKGIPDSEYGRIFEEFYQLDNPGRDRSRGVGLGLAIVQRLCELIGARISVESILGEGTSFQVSLPALPGALAAAGPCLPLPVQTALQGKRVYVVDDEIDILKGMRALLGIWGIEILTADSHDATERLFERHGIPDLMIVDLRLGEGEHGGRLADRLCLQYGTFPVLIITAETASEALRQANESGYTLLQKPIAAEILRRTVAAAIQSGSDPPSRGALETKASIVCGGAIA
jgi:signal transduction histidine kinase